MKASFDFEHNKLIFDISDLKNIHTIAKAIIDEIENGPNINSNEGALRRLEVITERHVRESHVVTEGHESFEDIERMQDALLRHVKFILDNVDEDDVKCPLIVSSEGASE